MAYVLVQTVVIPLLFVPIVYFLGSKIGAKAGYATLAALAYPTLLSLFAASQGGLLEFFDWRPIGMFGFNADGLSIPILVTVTLLCAVVSVYSIPYMKHRIGEEKREYGLYFTLYLLYSVGMIGTVLATNLIEFYLFFELMLVPSYFLIARWGYGDRDRISFMYFMWTHVGALALLAGILGLWIATGTFDISKLGAATVPPAYATWITVAMLLGLLVKMAAFGVHIWLPHAHAEAPTPISALLSPVMIGIGGYAIVRILLTAFPTAFKIVSPLLALWALVTMIYGGLMALVQDDLKRMMAYSSISQMGYILLGISSIQLLGVSGSMFHYMSHGLGKGILFMVAGAIILQAHGLRSISKLGGLASKMPVTATTALLGFLIIIGVPPTSGFISELMIFLGTFQSSFEPFALQRVILAIAAVASTAITTGYSLWTVKRVFFGPLPTELNGVREAPLTVTVPLLSLGLIAIVVGIYPDLVTRYLVAGVGLILGK